MKLEEYLDVAELRRHIAEGDVTERKRGEFSIFNYSKTCAYAGNWTDVTRKTRGLVWDSKKDQVLAIPFSKFFNKGERPDEEPPATEQPTAVFDKRDGSLGIVWCIPMSGMWQVATRGSFSSEQAKVGTKLLAASAGEANELRGPLGEGRLWDLDVNHTYLVEIVHPDTRIVVDYHGREGLDLLGVVDRLTGEEVPLADLTDGERKFWELAGQPSYPLDDQDLKTEGVRGFDAEGYVFLYADGTRLKVKHEDYVRLHRVMTGLSSRDVWRNAGATVLRELGTTEKRIAYVLGLPEEQAGKLDLERLRSEVPEEMLGWVDNVANELYRTAREELDTITQVVENHSLDTLEDKNERARIINGLGAGNKHLKSLLFAPAQQRFGIVWKTLLPERETFKEDQDA